MGRWPRRRPTPSGKFVLFDQGAFSEPGDGFADEGVVYVPQGCAEQPGCRVHIALHGCEQSREAVGDTFVKDSGFAEIADTNRIVVLFPQVEGEHDQPAWLLGLVGLYRARLSRQGRAADQGDLGHGRAAHLGAMSDEVLEHPDIVVFEAPLGSDLYRQALALREAILRRPLGLSISAEELADDETRQHFCALCSAAWSARYR